MQGVGPATASAVLTAADTSFPYMADEAMDISLDKQREYTVKRYVEYAALLRKKAEQLDGSVGEASKGERYSAVEAKTLQELCEGSHSPQVRAGRPKPWSGLCSRRSSRTRPRRRSADGQLLDSDPA